MTNSIDLKGMWEGSFNYTSSLDAGETQFKARMSDKDGEISGLVIEAHVNENGEARAEIKGRHDGAAITFTKTYVNQGSEYAAPVEYEGAIEPSGNLISGTWTLPQYSGGFSMRRVT